MPQGSSTVRPTNGLYLYLLPVPNVQWKTPDNGQRNCPKHVEFLDKIIFWKSVRLLVLLKKIVTKHGRMNLKLSVMYFLRHTEQT